MPRLAPFAALALLVATPAATPAIAADTCANATSQAQLNACAGSAAKAADARLNSVYGVVMARLSAPAKARLRDAQRSWISFRDKQCMFESNGNDGGSVAPMVANYCYAGLTDKRAKELTAFRTCVEGDVSCPR